MLSLVQSGSSHQQANANACKIGLLGHHIIVQISVGKVFESTIAVIIIPTQTCPLQIGFLSFFGDLATVGMSTELNFKFKWNCIYGNLLCSWHSIYHKEFQFIQRYLSHKRTIQEMHHRQKNDILYWIYSMFSIVLAKSESKNAHRVWGKKIIVLQNSCCGLLNNKILIHAAN